MKKRLENLNQYLQNVITKMILAVIMLTFFLLSFTSIVSGNGTSMTSSVADQQQEKRITGKVTDQTGATLVGVTVLVKGTTTGALTDNSGAFSLLVPANGQTLTFSFIGMVTKDIPIGNQTNFNITMEETAIGLEEVIVVGYGTEKKKDITGSVAVVRMDALKSIPTGSAAQALQGQASGVTITSSGMAGYRPDIRIRGISTLGDSYPLVLVDGVEANLNDISANDIESMQVLKDAGASAVYGVRGANGVIVITTKKGKSGAPVITYETYYGVTYPIPGNPLNLMNSDEFMKVSLIADPTDPIFKNGMPDYMYVSPGGQGVAMEGDPLVDPSKYHIDRDNPVNNYQIQKVNKVGTDWYHETSQKAPRMSHNLSASGGTDKATYMFSLGYYDEKGTLINTELKRYNARINTVFKPKTNFRIGENLNVFFKDNPIVPINADGGEFSPLGLHRNLVPIIPVYDIMGNWGGTRVGPSYLGTQRNPVALWSSMATNLDYVWSATGNAFAEIDFLKHFTARTSVGGVQSISHSTNLYVTEYSRSEFFSNPNKFSESSGWSSRIIWTNTLTYTNVIGKHNVNVLAGLESIRNYGRSLGGSREGYILESFDYLTLSSGTKNITNFSSHFEDRLYSQFAKLNYAYAEKYLFGATLRRDGSSKFGKDNRFGLFPSFSLGWRISGERFMENLKWIDDLKIRGSYGILGSQNNVNAANQFDLFGSSFIASYYDINGTSNSVVQGFYQSQMGNSQTGWERNIVSNFGLDLSVFKYVTFNLEVYKKSINGLLFTQPLPATVGGANAPVINIGDIQNTGIDFSSTVRGKVFNDLDFTFTANISSYKNKVVDVPGPGFFDGSWSTRNQEGRPVGSFFGYNIIGMFQTAEEVAEAPPQNGAMPGVFKYQDVNSDGVINTDDRTFIGNPNPDFVYGLNLELSYKGFDLSSNFYGSQGNDVYNTLMNYTHNWAGYESNKSRDLLNAWTPENTNTMVPKIDVNSNFSSMGSMNTYKIEDGSFFRMKSLIVGYTLPTSILKRFGITNFRIYAQGTNLFTLTGYKGYDPELQGSSTLFGIDTAPYPVGQKSFLVGLSLSF